MKFRKHYIKFLLDTLVFALLYSLFRIEYLILILLFVLDYSLFLLGFNITRQIINIFNPNFYKLKTYYYRHKLDESILERSFSLSIEEKHLVELVKNKIEKTIYFEYLLKSDSLDYVYNQFKNGITTREIKYLVKTVCKLLKLDTKFIEISIYAIGDSLKSPLGYFRPKGNVGGEIGISINSFYDVKILLSIIIHECSHYFMHVYNLYFDEFNEYATDLIAVYIGFGKYMIEGYKTITIIDNKFLPGFRNLTIGYLNEKQLAYVERKYHY